MKELTCIVCPVGCHIHIDDQLSVTGNRCPRGKEYALIEMTAPTRMLTTTVKTRFSNMPRLSVKTQYSIPKNKIYDILYELRQVEVTKRVKIGDIILSNVCQTGIDIIATKSILSDEMGE